MKKIKQLIWPSKHNKPLSLQQQLIQLCDAVWGKFNSQSLPGPMICDAVRLADFIRAAPKDQIDLTATLDKYESKGQSIFWFAAYLEFYFASYNISTQACPLKVILETANTKRLNPNEITLEGAYQNRSILWYVCYSAALTGNVTTLELFLNLFDINTLNLKDNQQIENTNRQQPIPPLNTQRKTDIAVWCSESIMHLAVRTNAHPIIMQLLKGKVDLGVVNDNNLTPLLLALSMRYLDIAMLLIPEPNKIEVIRQIDEEVQLKGIAYFKFPASVAQLEFLSLKKSIVLIQEKLQKQETATYELTNTPVPLRFTKHFPSPQASSTLSTQEQPSAKLRLNI